MHPYRNLTLNQPPEIVTNLSGITDVSCLGICDGTATVMAEGAACPTLHRATCVFVERW
ncbi:MAG: hypothetical protein R2778_18485 [Saprospiraceae bacterium]